ncbi:hypothetical protein ACHAWO_001502 [Cyclotella atomus]|uniref:Uncharacterized protein n=1 Tax=Cyclotella atomus TaxID=382360 RepID=A0ABD3QUW0_9STRA
MMTNQRCVFTFLALLAMSSVSGFTIINSCRIPTVASSRASVLFAQDETREAESEEIMPQTAGEAVAKEAVRCPDCDLCDGSGRILGGIGTVLEWWPIKAYRPCPNFVDRGGKYVRSGQGLDEIAFGRIQKD